MKYVLVLLFSFTTCIVAFAQQTEFLNLSICPSPEMSLDEEINAYVQGGGHNYYLSYTPEDHVGSFSGDFFPGGTEQDRLSVQLDPGNDPTEPFVNSGVWTNRYPERDIPVEQLGYDAIAPYVFNCVAEEEEM